MAFFVSLCPSHSCCRGVRSISEGLIKGCYLEKHFSKRLSILKLNEVSLEVFFFFFLTLLLQSCWHLTQKGARVPRFCCCDFRRLCQATMSPVSSEGDTSERLVRNNNPASKNTPGAETIDRCDGREVTAR